MRELARAAIFPAPTLPQPHRQPLAAWWRPGVGGYRGPPPCPLTQGDGAPLMGRGAELIGGFSRGPTRVAARNGRRGGPGGSGSCRKKWRLLSGETQVVVKLKDPETAFWFLSLLQVEARDVASSQLRRVMLVSKHQWMAVKASVPAKGPAGTPGKFNLRLPKEDPNL